MASRRDKMQFGLFIPPQHYPEQNPTRAIHSDLETIAYVESLGFEEAWVGEHHSSGYEIIGPSDIFLAAAVERTSRIKLGTGVASLPYHHPFHVAERAVMLDHLSMGRTMLGVGPGSIPTDAAMLGIPWAETRSRTLESWEAIHHLLTDDEPLTVKTDWFTLDNAALQIAPYSSPAMEFAFTAMESPFGPSLAGKYGAGLISLSAMSAAGYGSLGKHWTVVEEQAKAHGQVVDRKNWRIVTMIHVAETREQARKDVEVGLPRFVHYTSQVAERTLEWMAGDGEPDPNFVPSLEDLIGALGGTKIACVGTPDDAIQMIRALEEITGGFGKLLILSGDDWTTPEAKKRGLELFAREVMPVFEGSSAATQASRDRSIETRTLRVSEQRASIRASQQSYIAPTT